MSAVAPPDPIRFRRAMEAMSRLYGLPAAGAFAPGRVNLIGDHTDYAGGLALPIAIDRGCLALGRLRERSPESPRLQVLSINRGEERRVYSLDAKAPGAWWSYVQGVVAQFARRWEIPSQIGLDIVVSSDVPPGSGLSSSAALEVSCALMLTRLLGVEMATHEIARLCRDAEHEFAGVPCGLMDQLAGAMGQSNHALYMDFSNDSVRPIALPAWLRIVVVNTGVRHTLAVGGYAARREAALRATQPDPKRHGELDALARQMLEHVTSENERVRRVASALGAPPSSAVATLVECVRQSQASLRDNVGVSCDELNDICDRINGAGRSDWAARLTGAGMGGCAVILGAGFTAEDVRALIAGPYQARFARVPDVFEVRPSAGGSVVRLDEPVV